MILTKICKACKMPQDISAFRPARGMKDGFLNQCKACSHRALDKGKALARGYKWRRANPDRARANYRAQAIKKKYGLSREQLAAMKTAQNGRCFVCEKTARLFVDHNHTTGQIRKLLCNNCNFALGHLQEDLSIARSMVKYIVVHCKGRTR